MVLHYTDLHIHSKYSRATSKDMTLENLAKYGKVKGLGIIGTGDFTHPRWFKDLKTKLSFDNGIYNYNGMKFLFTTEISLIYTQDKKHRRIHHLILAPDISVVEQINEWLGKKGRLDYDGRPIFGFSSIELVENLLAISKDIMIIPAHAWTPWYGIFGSMSGFDSIKECFREKEKHIYAIETGLSSDPRMNWGLSELDKVALVSFSDAHSAYPWRLGRECCLFDLKRTSYREITGAIKEKDKDRLISTIEFFPEEGKYHFDGHGKCNVSLSPKESNKLGGICPVCKKSLTIGVLNRVEQLADREDGYRPKGAIDFKSLIPLSELIAKILKTNVYSERVREAYDKMISRFGTELNVLMNVSEEELKKITHEKVANAIIKSREGKLKFKPGYDGVYGVPLFSGADKT